MIALRGARSLRQTCRTLLNIMDKHFSLYLDLTRFSAALLVVLTHYIQQGLIGPAAQGTMPLFGREAVIVFFVLSGFVIAYASAEKALTLRQYVVARSARIYSVAAPLVLLCFLLVYLVSQYTELPANLGYQARKPYIYLPLHFLFMGELWNLSETPPWLIQYWSLGYEVWYYVLFGVVFYLRGTKRLLLGAMVLLVMGFKLWLLLPVWLAGVYMYKRQKDLPLTPVQARLGWLATILALCAYKYFAVDVTLRALGNQIWPFPSLHLGSADRFLADYLVCLLVYLNFTLARQCAFTSLQAIETPIRALAAYTFTLYLIHGPVIGIWKLFYPHDATSALDLFLLSASIAMATWLLGLVTERRKAWFQGGAQALLLLCSRRIA
jgi:peptidoglycan/LPS O-acetylase OafA/YrhL